MEASGFAFGTGSGPLRPALIRCGLHTNVCTNASIPTNTSTQIESCSRSSYRRISLTRRCGAAIKAVDMPTALDFPAIGDLCNIQMGMTARGPLDTAELGATLALQLRDINLSGVVDWNTVARIDADDKRDRYLVGSGDIVFRSRGERSTAAVVNPNHDNPVLVVAPLIILRPKTTLVSADYLAWAINQAPVQRQFDEEAQGTNLRMVSKTTLEKATISVPDRETQQRILEIDALAERERALSQQLTAKRYDLMHRLLTDRAAQAVQHRAVERISK